MWNFGKQVQQKSLMVIFLCCVSLCTTTVAAESSAFDSSSPHYVNAYVEVLSASEDLNFHIDLTEADLLVARDVLLSADSAEVPYIKGGMFTHCIMSNNLADGMLMAVTTGNMVKDNDADETADILVVVQTNGRSNRTSGYGVDRYPILFNPGDVSIDDVKLYTRAGNPRVWSVGVSSPFTQANTTETAAEGVDIYVDHYYQQSMRPELTYASETEQMNTISGCEDGLLSFQIFIKAADLVTLSSGAYTVGVTFTVSEITS